MRIILLLAVLLAPLFGQDLVGLYLTWSADPATTMTVNWVDLRTASSLDVHYRRIGTPDWKVAKGTKFAISDTTLQGRRVQLTALAPDSNYEFMIGKKIEKAGEGWRFRTMPRDLNRPVHFIAGGDMMNTRARLDKMNAVVGSLDPDFAVLTGDLAYANGVSSARWADWLKSWMQHSVGQDGRLIPMVVGIGNHEVKGGYKGKIPGDAPFYYSLFQTPGAKSYFAQDFADYLSLLVLDTDHTEPIAGPQAAWLEQALSARAKKQFQFVTYHYPAYGTTKVPKDGKTPLDSARSIEIRKEWMPHWEKYGVTAVLEHDHHNYKRTHPLRGHKRDDENGILYLGDGAYAVNPRTVPSKEEGWWLAKAEGRNHVWSFRLRADGTALIQAVDIEGKVFDKVELKTPRTKPVGAPTVVSSGGK